MRGLSYSALHRTRYGYRNNAGYVYPSDSRDRTANKITDNTVTRIEYFKSLFHCISRGIFFLFFSSGQLNLLGQLMFYRVIVFVARAINDITYLT